MHILDINDSMFAIKRKFPTDAFAISDYITLTSGNTHLGSGNKLQQEFIMYEFLVATFKKF